MGKSNKNKDINAPHLEAGGQFPKLRGESIHRGIRSREEALRHTRQYKKTHPTSNKPNLGALRHKATPTKAVIEAGGSYYQPPGFTPVKHDPHTGQFISPQGGQYLPRRRVSAVTPGGTQTVALALGRAKAPKRSLSTSFDREPDIEASVELTYQHLAKPKGMDKRINNNAVQQGSAKTKFEEQKAALTSYLEQHVEKENVDAFIAALNESKFEHTHHLAAHFGNVFSTTGEAIDPRNPTATSPMPAAFNSEMMLLEKLTDYLLFINKHSYKYGNTQPSVKFGYRGAYVPNTRLFAWFELEVTDLRIGKTYSERWDAPLEHTEKPSLVGYQRIMASLKANPDELLPVLTADHPQDSSQQEADHDAKGPAQPPKSPRHK